MMTNEWKNITLEECSILNPPLHISKNSKAKKVGMESVIPFTKKIYRHTYDDYKGGAKFQNRDTLLARITPCLENGKTAYVDFLKENEIGFGSTEFIVLRSNKNICDSHFLYYLACSPDFRDTAISSMTGSSGRQRVQIEEIRSYEFLLPPLPEQKVIAEVLSSLDDKIDLLRRENETLEALAETIFRQWFVEEAEDDWKAGTLSDEFIFTMGLSPSGSSYNEEGLGIPLFQGSADFQFRFPNKRVYTTDPKRYAEQYDTIISVRAPVGEQNMAYERCCIGRGVAAFRYKKYPQYYSYTYYKIKSLLREIRVFDDSGTVFGSITKSDFESIMIKIPPSELIDRYQKIVNPFDEKVFKNSFEIRTLEQLRDTLIPKLISGEIRVRYDKDH